MLAQCSSAGDGGDECCYSYTKVPGDLACNPQGRPRDVTLVCETVTPNTTTGHVRWYRSELRELAGITGDMIGIDEFDASNDTSSSDLHIGFTRSVSYLPIDNFTSRANGHYWCLMEVNNSCLLPSSSGHVVFSHTAAMNCTSDDIIIIGVSIKESPICADNPDPHHSEGHTADSSPLPTPTATPVPPLLSRDQSSVGYGVTGVVVFFIAMLSAALTLLASIALSRRRRSRHTIVKMEAKG